jgi:uncharacterized protein with PIN domain
MILGTSVVIAILQREPSRQPFLILVLDPDVEPVDGALARRAAQLNVGDCFAAALAEREHLPLAFARGDFSAPGC